MRIKGTKKMRQSARNKRLGVYARQLVVTTRNKHRRAIRNERRLAAVKLHPEIGSPSQLWRRAKLRRKEANQ